MENNKTNMQRSALLSHVLKNMPTSNRRFNIPCEIRDIANGLYIRAAVAAAKRGADYTLTEGLRKIIRSSAEWLSDPDAKPWLLFMGLCGNGKSTLARAIFDLIKDSAERILGYNEFSVRYRNARELVDLFVRDRDAFDRVAEADFLVIDDLGTEPQEIRNYGMTHTPIIDLFLYRYERNRMTLITTNLEGDELCPHYGERIVDRLREQSLTLTFLDSSFRGSGSGTPPTPPLTRIE